MKTSTKVVRRDKILDAAENAFAQTGFEGASLRQIVSDAGVNLATVYYYFGSKEGLMEAVLDRRFAPIHQEHMEGLRQLEQDFQGRPVPLEQILETMLLPPLRFATESAQGLTVMRLIGRVAGDPNPQIQELLHCKHSDVREAYLAAIHRSVPHLAKADLWWRFEFVWGAFIFILCNPNPLDKITNGLCNPCDTSAVLAQMVAAFSAGFRAPSVSQKAQTPGAATKSRSRS